MKKYKREYFFTVGNDPEPYSIRYIVHKTKMFPSEKEVLNSLTSDKSLPKGYIKMIPKPKNDFFGRIKSFIKSMFTTRHS